MNYQLKKISMINLIVGTELPLNFGKVFKNVILADDKEAIEKVIEKQKGIKGNTCVNLLLNFKKEDVNENYMKQLFYCSRFLNILFFLHVKKPIDVSLIPTSFTTNVDRITYTEVVGEEELRLLHRQFYQYFPTFNLFNEYITKMFYSNNNPTTNLNQLRYF